MPDLIQWLGSIGETGQDIMISVDDERTYDPFIINRGLAQSQDTVLLAEQMNRSPELSKRAQYAFYLHAVTKKRRYAKWAKKDKVGDEKMIAKHYGVNLERGMDILNRLTPEQLEAIRSFETDTGGKSGR